MNQSGPPYWADEAEAEFGVCDDDAFRSDRSLHPRDAQRSRERVVRSKTRVLVLVTESAACLQQQFRKAPGCFDRLLRVQLGGFEQEQPLVRDFVEDSKNLQPSHLSRKGRVMVL